MTVNVEDSQERPLEVYNTASALLSGMPDYSGGQAEAYFRELNDHDREIVSWYLQQGIGPYQIQYYVSNLARGYAVADPDRTASDAMESAHTELGRINRLLDIFLADGDYFPHIETCNISVRDEAGNYEGFIEIQGWTRFGTSGEGPFSIQSLKSALKNRRVDEYIKLAHEFIDDPTSAPHIFNQDEMLRQVQEPVAYPSDMY